MPDQIDFDFRPRDPLPSQDLAVMEWPEAQRFPLNLRGRRVADRVLEDLRDSDEPLVVAGYAGLDRLAAFAAELGERPRRLRILLGSEPHPGQTRNWRLGAESLPDEIAAHWLERGVSLTLCGALIQLVEGLRSGRVEARWLGDQRVRLHAKLYCGDNAITLGSSNFTNAGLERSFEANARFARTGHESKRFREARQIADNLWQRGVDYNEGLLALLEQLLQPATWSESLARACAELLEGDWAESLIELQRMPGDTPLWPSQRQGIAQALFIAERQGSALVADATGAGKTRMGAHLIRALRDHTFDRARLRRGNVLMICPPAVRESWDRESDLAAAQLDIHSHGVLSHAGSERQDRSADALRRAQILCVDEGHNFLNLKSNRTQLLLRNMADHVVLFTATPINRSVVDLLRIADMLGADNLAPSTVEAFGRLLGRPAHNLSLTGAELGILRREIERFTVRRTKAQLNRLVDESPQAYRDHQGRPCRFPAHRPRIYRLDEPAEDRELARQIGGLADHLRGVSHFQKPLRLPSALRRQGWTDGKYLDARLRSAGRLARYQVMAALRSSRAALAEHLAGTEIACDLFGLADFRKASASGDMLGRLTQIAGHPPKNHLDADLPDWLRDAEAHRAACREERALYREILELCGRMSPARERAKAMRLAQLAAGNDLVLAFDSHPLTLALVRRLVHEISPQVQALIATGDPGSERARLLASFRPGSGARGIIGLCSDSLAEGVNLQQASAVVHLDMPSVVRIAEQRVGRVDRMDSPHREIEAWWPDDAPEFALSSDERFIERHETVDALLGSNLPLPEEILERKRSRVGAEELVREYEAQAAQAPWDGIRDAFTPVRELVSGGTPLVDPVVYERIRRLKAGPISRVSPVGAGHPWAFFCLAGTERHAPRWILVEEDRAEPTVELGAVCEALRRHLRVDTPDRALDSGAERTLGRFLERLSGAERSLLPRKKQRALEEMTKVIGRYRETASERRTQAEVDFYGALLEALAGADPNRQPDWDSVAERWLDLIRPVWYERLKDPRRKRPLLLADIRADLLGEGALPFEAIRRAFAEFPVQPAGEERILACILGVPGG